MMVLVMTADGKQYTGVPFDEEILEMENGLELLFEVIAERCPNGASGNIVSGDELGPIMWDCEIWGFRCGDDGRD